MPKSSSKGVQSLSNSGMKVPPQQRLLKTDTSPTRLLDLVGVEGCPSPSGNLVSRAICFPASMPTLHADSMRERESACSSPH
eukprot:4128694-Amphidinium_carterae.1